MRESGVKRTAERARALPDASARTNSALLPPELVVRVGVSAPIVFKGHENALRDRFDVANELRMVKTALLYADRVVLTSPRVAQIGAWRRIVDGRIEDFEQIVRSLAPSWSPGSDLRPPSREVAVSLAEGYLVRVGREPTWTELEHAIRTGLVEVGEVPAVERLGYHPGTVLGGMIGFLADSLDPRSEGVPLLDETVAAVLRAATVAGVLSRPLPPGTKAVGLAARYLGYIPAFPEAPLDLLVDARAALTQPLLGFRAAMADLALEMEGVPSTPEFAATADDAYRRVLVPALAELEAIARERKLLPLLAAEARSPRAGTLAKAALALTFAGAAAWPEVAQAAVGALVAAADIASGAIDRYRDLSSRRQANRILWLYEVDRRVRPVRRKPT